MLNRLAILAILAVVMPLHGGTQEVPLKNQKDSQASSHQAEPTNRNQGAQSPMGSAYVPKENGKKGNQAAQNRQNQTNNHSPDYAKWGFIVSIFVALTSLAIAISSLVQARAAKESADETRAATRFTESTVKVSERADILLEKVSFVTSTTGSLDEHCWLRLQFRNFGRSILIVLIN